MSRNGIFGAVATVFALIVVSNASSAGEVSRSVFYLWFSAGAAVFWGAFMFVAKGEKKTVLSLLAILGAIGIGVNLYYCLSISGMWGSLDSLSPYAIAEEEGIVNASDDSIPLFNSNDEYICIHSDLRQIASTGDLPGLMNILAERAAGDDAFTRADAFTVFTDGVTDIGNGNYMVNTDASYEVLVRCENMDPESRYYIVSSFGGSNTLTETYRGADVVSALEGPYVKLMDRHTDAVSIRQTGAAPIGSASLNIWRADPAVLDILRGEMSPMEDFGGTAIDDPSLTSVGDYTVITSVPYGNYEIEVKLDGRNTIISHTFNYGGRLAASFFSHGASLYTFRIRSSLVVPVISAVIWVLSVGFVIYNVIKNRKRQGGTSC